MFYTRILAKIRGSQLNAPVSGNDLFDISPPVITPKNADDQRVAPLIERPHETRPRSPGVSGLAVNIFFPSGEKDLVMAFERDLAAGAGIDRLVFSLDRFAEK